MAETFSFPPGPQINFWRSLLSGQGPTGSNRLEFMADSIRDYGQAVHYKFGGMDIFMFFDPDAVHQVLVAQADKFQKSLLTKRLLGKLMGEGLLLSEGDYWRRQRRLVQPSFHMNRIEAYAEVMADHAGRTIQTWGSSPSVRNVHEDMMALTLAIVAKMLFDADVSDEVGRVGDAMEQLQSLVNRVTGTVIPIPEWVPTPLNVEGARARKILDEIVMGMIQKRRESSEDRGDLLSMLLMAQDEEGTGGMADKQVRDEAMTLFLAGHETTALALTWTWYLLSQSPDVEAKLHKELDTVLAGRAPTLRDLANLPFTEMVVREGMRIYPPAYIMARYSLADVHIGDYDVPKGSAVLMSPYFSHRDPRWWPEPEKFDPERFTPGWEDRIPKYAYFPFGGGPRICIGNSFAHMEARLLLAALAQRFTLTLIPGQRIEPEPLITLRPRYGMNMVITPRMTAKAEVAQPALNAIPA